MNAAMRWGSVNVVYNSSAVVRNSSEAVTVVVLTEILPVDVVVVLGVPAAGLGDLCG